MLPVLPAETVFCAAGAVLSCTAALPCAAAAAACVFLPEESAELLTVPYCADTGSVFLWLSHHVLTLLVMEEIRLVLFAELELVLLPALLVVLLADPARVLPVLVAEALPADDDDLLLDVLVLPVLVLLLLLLLPDELEVPEDELLLPVEDDDEDQSLLIVNQIGEDNTEQVIAEARAKIEDQQRKQEDMFFFIQFLECSFFSACTSVSICFHENTPYFYFSASPRRSWLGQSQNSCGLWDWLSCSVS